MVLGSTVALARVRPVATKADRDYVSALATADHFLQAWQTQDPESGLMMLTDTAKEHWSEDRLEAFFATGDHAAYQISAGRKLKAGRYSFPVALLETSGKVRRRFSEIVVMRMAGQDWAVDKLP